MHRMQPRSSRLAEFDEDDFEILSKRLHEYYHMTLDEIYELKGTLKNCKKLAARSFFCGCVEKVGVKAHNTDLWYSCMPDYKPRRKPWQIPVLQKMYLRQSGGSLRGHCLTSCGNCMHVMHNSAHVLHDHNRYLF